MKTQSYRKFTAICILLIIGLAGCKAEAADSPEVTKETAAQPSDQNTVDNHQEPSSAPAVPSGGGESDLAAIETAWRSSPHADTFILDDQGQNNSCARCHSPVNWSPSMGELPESCFACKFELEEPAPLVPENVWANISCNVCHEVDKKGNVQAEYAWLEIAPLEEYADVASPTELCLKCHGPVDIPDHGSVTVSGVHQGYECTICHSAHSTVASCDAAGCHDSASIAAHDAYHQDVKCTTCHDGDGMELAPAEETGLWNTFLTAAGSAGENRFPYTSHNMVREVDCSRCHFTSNPWGLLEDVVQP